MKGKVYLLNVRNMDKLPSHVSNKFFAVRSCKNPEYYTNNGWCVNSLLSPNTKLFGQYLNWKKSGMWNQSTFNMHYKPAFEEQMRTNNNMRLLLNCILERLLLGEDVAFMCFCENLNMCHTRILGEAFVARGFEVVRINRNAIAL